MVEVYCNIDLSKSLTTSPYPQPRIPIDTYTYTYKVWWGKEAIQPKGGLPIPKLYPKTENSDTVVEHLPSMCKALGSTPPLLNE
jgi:hypothetical protein